MRRPRAYLPHACLAAAAALLIGNAEPVPAPAQPVPAQQMPAQPMPADIKTMLDAAMASGNDGEVSTVAKYAKTAAPDAAHLIDVAVDDWRTARNEAAEAKIRDAGPLQLWTGKAQVGGYMTTGNTHDTGFSAAIDLSRESLDWRHKFHAQADYQRSAGVVTRDHYLASYEPNYKFSPRGYIYGAAQYESDHFLGYDDRYSASVGAGYSAIKQPRVQLDLELGPAYRDTRFTDGTIESSVAARGSFDLDWKLTHAISLTQTTSAYLQHYNSTVSSVSAVNAKLIGPLSAQLSYNVQYESMPPVGSVSTDTTSRASLVYSF